nr:hypothetical protein [Fredinandcohnia onubensis]
MIEGKGLGGKKVNRVNISLSNSYELKLNKLATACNIRYPGTLAALLVEMCLDDTKLVSYLQNEYCIQDAYRVIPVQKYHNGDVEYLLKGE